MKKYTIQMENYTIQMEKYIQYKWKRSNIATFDMPYSDRSENLFTFEYTNSSNFSLS
jgi:hypothetical protein